MLKGNNNYSRTVTRTYDTLTRFELASPRNHHTKRIGDKGSRGSCGFCGGRNHTFVQHTTPLGTVFVPVIDGCTSYRIECFNFEKWWNYDNQCPEPTRDAMRNDSGQNLVQIGRCLVQSSSGGALSNNWLLLDSFYTISCAKKNLIVSNINVSPF